MSFDELVRHSFPPCCGMLRAVHRLAPPRDFALVVGDAGIDDEGVPQLRAARAEVVVAPLR
ncbi:MAG: hypothetical protein KY456_08115 [Chloroflexi bacterium]|nr:hypothetical protein [Chloroflexota bacterium]